MIQIASRNKKYCVCSLKNVIVYFSLYTQKNTFSQGDSCTSANKEKKKKNPKPNQTNRNHVCDLSIPDK